MSISCGHCQGHHNSVSDVRACYAGERESSVQTKEAPTEKQMNFAQKLGRTRKRLDVHAEMGKLEYENFIAGMSKHEISRFISAMVDQPYEDVDKDAWELPHPEVPEGRYAVERDGKVHFYRVVDADEGRPRRLLHVHGAPRGFSYTQVWKSKEAAKVMEEISKDVDAALILFGHEMGACGACGSPLTDEDSRARGIGPICAAKR